jgi:exonuclease III
VSVLSWNVHGLKNYLCDPDFLALICNYDVIILSETWTNSNDPFSLDIDGFVSDHVYGRKSASKRGRCSGGVSVYYRSNLKDHISVTEKCSNNIVWVKLSGSLFDFDCDVIVGGVYIIPEYSKARRTEDADCFELLEQGIVKYNDSKLIILGDFNARTGTRTDDLELLRPDRFVDTTWSVPDVNIDTRVSQDHVIDTRGRRLLELCKSTGLMLANGRLGSDNNLGQLTFTGSNGSSVVDYCMLRPDDCTHITEFNVLSFNEFSDHAPLSLSICCVEPIVNIHAAKTEETCVNKIVWDESKADQFRGDLLENVHCLDSLTTRLNECGEEGEISTIVSDFSEFVFNHAFSNCGLKYTTGKQKRPNRRPTNTWFNSDCVQARIKFCRARNSYLRHKSDENRKCFVKCRSHFNSVKRKARISHKYDEGRKLSKLARTNPRKFWKIVKKGKQKKDVDSNVTADDFLSHFTDVFGGDDDGHRDDIAESECPVTEPELDEPISMDEVEHVIKSLQKQKSCGLDAICAEVYQSAFDILSPFIVTLFNMLFERGIYPRSWADGLIIPVHKKGETDNVNNYRGITLVNVISKVYSHVLTARLYTWAENYDNISVNQFGFQRKKSTADCIFVLHSIIAKVLGSGNKLYCAFVDFQRAFDNVDRNLLWYKLVQEGVSTKMLAAIKAIYHTVRSCVKYNDCMSEFFLSHCGVKQGEPLSPFLFVMFINDMVANINHDLNDIVDVHELQLFLLLYADDSVIFAKSKESLQAMLNDLNEYCCTWGLTVNTAKTKIMIFENGRKTDACFCYDQTMLDVVDSFNYLGITLFKNGGWYRTQKCLRDRGMYALHKLFNILDLTREG